MNPNLRWVRQDDIVGLVEASRRLEAYGHQAKPNTLHHYSCGRHTSPTPFPAHIARVNQSRVFSFADIKLWMDEWARIRSPGRKRTPGEDKRSTTGPEKRAGGVGGPKLVWPELPPQNLKAATDPMDIHPEFRETDDALTIVVHDKSNLSIPRCIRAMCPNEREPGERFCLEHL